MNGKKKAEPGSHRTKGRRGIDSGVWGFKVSWMMCGTAGSIQRVGESVGVVLS